MMRRYSNIDFSKYLEYDESSPSGLRWVVNMYALGDKGKLNASAGQSAGCKHKVNGYWDVKINGELYKGHRIVLALHGVDCGNLQVDHINRIRSDNRLVNLRVVDRPTNLRNQGIYGSNKTGINGVSFEAKARKSGNVSQRFIAQWYDLCSMHHQKSFSVGKYGHDEAFRLACEYRAKMIEQLNAQGAGYSETHGQ